MVKKQFLVVTNNSELVHSIQHFLENNQSTTLFHAASLSQALSYMAEKLYCLLMLDLQFPDINMMEMVRIFRVGKHFPILALTETLSADEKVMLLHAGVDSFLEKPIDPALCLAQADALVELYLKTDQELSNCAPITVGISIVIFPRYRRVFLAGKPLELTRKEFDLLYFFVKHPRQVFTKSQLYRQVWGDFYELGGDETVKAHIKMLRKKLSVLDTNLIENEWGVGYRFVPPI